MVVTWSHFLNIHPLVPLIFWIVLCCIHPFQTPHLLFTRIKLLMNLVLRSQPALSFFMSMWGNLKNNSQWRMTSSHLCLICFILTYFFYSSISIFSCENPSLDVSNSDHSQNAQDVSLSFDCGENRYFFMNPPNLSSFISINWEGEIFSFSSTPIYDSSDHEDVDVHIKFSDHGCCDLFIHSFDHNSDSLAIDLSKPPIFHDLSSDEVETPQDIKAL